MVIRDQKTRAQMGHYKCALPQIVKDLMESWVQDMREEAKRNTQLNHDMVFFNIRSGKPFNQQDFSKYATAAFLEVTGHHLNIQIMRKIVTEGLPWPKKRVGMQCTFCRLLAIAHIGRRVAMAGDRHAYRSKLPEAFVLPRWIAKAIL